MVAIDNKIEQAMVSCSAAPPRTFLRHHAGGYARGWASRSRVGALPRAGGPSAHGGSHSPFRCQAELLFVCDRRDAHWLQPLRSAQGARVDMEGDFEGLGLTEPGSLGARELQPPKPRGRGGGWRVLLDAEIPERWWLRELYWVSTKPWLGFQGWGGEG